MAVGARTVWTLTMGDTGIRCLRDKQDPKLYVLETKTDKGWKATEVTSDNPGHLLRRVAGAVAVVEALTPKS